MTSDHITLDRLADYCAGLLPSGEADEVTSHLAQCTLCAAQADAVHRVPIFLAAAASDAPPMPESVWRDLDEALREEALRREGDARRQGASSLAARRAAQRPASRGRTRWSLLAAAAAVVAVAGGVAVTRGLGGSDSTANSAASPARADAASVGSAGGRVASQAAPSMRQQPEGQLNRGILSPRNLSQYADQLATTKSGPPASSSDKLAGSCATPRRSASDIVAFSRWEGAPAVVVVSPQARRVQVLDCRTASVLLYSTSY